MELMKCKKLEKEKKQNDMTNHLLLTDEAPELSTCPVDGGPWHAFCSDDCADS